VSACARPVNCRLHRRRLLSTALSPPEGPPARVCAILCRRAVFRRRRQVSQHGATALLVAHAELAVSGLEATSVLRLGFLIIGMSRMSHIQIEGWPRHFFNARLENICPGFVILMPLCIW